MTTTIAISNEKGGVAKTTTTLSLGAALAELGQNILLIDLDAQANLTLALGFEPGEARQTSSNIMLDNASIQSVSLKTDFEKLESGSIQFTHRIIRAISADAHQSHHYFATRHCKRQFIL